MTGHRQVIEDAPDCADYQTDAVRNRVILGDATTVLTKLPTESCDLIFIDPPYFLQLPKKELRRWKARSVVDAVHDRWDRFESFEEYDRFVTGVLENCRRIMKPSATIWVISTYHSIFRIGRIMQDLGFWVLNDLIWIKTNPMPNWLGVRFTNATESLIWAARDKDRKNYTFHKDLAKQFGIGKVGANAWVIPTCTGTERIKDEDGKKLHSTQKPIELLKRVILTTTNEGDLVLDPMAGTGTTAHVAHALNRDFIAVERNPDYAHAIIDRIEHPLPELKLDWDNPGKINGYLGLNEPDNPT